MPKKSRPSRADNTQGWTPVTDLTLEGGDDDDEDQQVAVYSLETCNNYKIVNGQVVIDHSQNEETTTTTPEHKKEKKKKKNPDKNEKVDENPPPTTKKSRSADLPQPPLPPPLSPHWEEFSNILHPSLTAALATKFFSPTTIQRLCLFPGIQGGKDILGTSETGSGKTLAFGLIVLHGLLSNPPRPGSGLAALILTPTRELAMQITHHLRDILFLEPLSTRPRVEPLVGGMAEEKQQRVLSKEPAVVVATLGRLGSIVENGNSHLSHLNESLRYLVLDEADRMCDRAHIKDLEPITRLLEQGDKRRQTMLFSATLAENDAVQALMKRLGKRGKPQWCCTAHVTTHVGTSGGEPTSSSSSLPSTLHMYRIDCLDEEKDANLYYFLKDKMQSTDTPTCLVFVTTVNAARRVHGTLSYLFKDGSVTTLHANMEQKQRLRHLDKFKNVESSTASPPLRIMVATDVAARGLDIPNVDFVVHYAVPTSADVYIHRSGRTARAGKTGVVLTLVGGSDEIAFARIVKDVPGGRSAIDKYPVSHAKLQLCTRVASLASQIHAIETKVLANKTDKSWRTKAAQEIGIILSDDDEIGSEDEDGRFKRGGALKSVLKQADLKNKKSRDEKELARLKMELERGLVVMDKNKGKTRFEAAGTSFTVNAEDRHNKRLKQ